MTNPLQPGIPATRKSWRRISITAPSSLTDLICSFLCGITGQGTEQTESKEGWETMTAYLAESPDAEKQLLQIKQFFALLQDSLPSGQQLRVSFSSLDDQDWNRTWKEHFKPEHITPRLVIKPTWESYTPAGGEKIIEMDPGMAFGTGHHASTRLCVQFIDQLLQSSTVPQTVLDVGTGTGILAMAAVLLGAHSALAIDNDPEAVKVASENIQRNKLSDKIEASGIDLQDARGRFDLIIANIIYDTLLFLAPQICEKMEAGGHLILAGILAGEQAESIAKTYAGLGIAHLATRQEGEWVALLFSNSMKP
ncbi:MAG: 50S ribosomal protein L11 methyltransferase [Deltaproteobacteria bacterium]